MPAALEALVHQPELLGAAWGLWRAVVTGGRLARTTKELIALSALAAGRVPLAGALALQLTARGLDEQVVADVQRTGSSPRLPARTRRLLAFGSRAALQPALLGDGDFTRLRRDGLGDPELAELLALAGLLSLVTTLSRGLGLRSEG